MKKGYHSGLTDKYRLPENYNKSYHLTGDGVVVPVVRYLADRILAPILDHHKFSIALVVRKTTERLLKDKLSLFHARRPQ